MYKIGLTGGIATGKTTVADYLRHKQIPVIDADQIARQVVAPHSEGLARLVTRFGEGILQADGGLNRAELGARVFADASKLAELNALLHPLIFAEIERQCATIQAPLCVIDMPLLYEVGYEDKVDEVWVVYVPEEVQRERLMRRNQLSQERAQQMIDAQLPIQEKKNRADYVIDNQASQAVTCEQIEALLQIERRNPNGLS